MKNAANEGDLKRDTKLIKKMIANLVTQKSARAEVICNINCMYY
jgi:hypothetical protein